MKSRARAYHRSHLTEYVQRRQKAVIYARESGDLTLLVTCLEMLSTGGQKLNPSSCPLVFLYSYGDWPKTLMRNRVPLESFGHLKVCCCLGCNSIHIV